MGFKFASFGAATVPLSKIIVDKDLDLRPHGVIARYCRAPVDPIVWPTETLDWGDTAETVQTLADNHVVSRTEVLFSANSGNEPTKWVLNLTAVSFPYGTKPVIQILVNGAEILDTGALSYGAHEFVFYAPAGASIVVNHTSANPEYNSSCIAAGATLKNTGFVTGPKTFNLAGKWLALGIDMKGLAATVKIQGVEVPYSDYAKYFPLVPTELKIPGNWSPTQKRPVIKVYK